MVQSYRVRFYRTVANNVGRQFRSDLGTVEVQDARDETGAVTEAMRVFERQRGLRRWNDLAHGFSVENEGPEGPRR